MSGGLCRRRLGVAAALVDGAVVAGDVVVADGRVVEVGAQPATRGGRLAVPGFVDVQVNGFAGVDFDGCDLDGYRTASVALARTGVTAVLATLPTTAPGRYRAALATAAAAVAEDLGGAQVVGVHLEGPFLAPGYAGAHPVEHLRAPDRRLADQLLDQAPVALVTLAPEPDGALDLVTHLRRRGVVVSLGHTGASAAQARAAIDAGATAVTHLWNAQRPPTARDGGVVAVALTHPDVWVCAIADGIHLSPEVLALSVAAAGDRFVAVTDAVAAAAMADGEHRFGGRAVWLADGAVRLADGTLAGSAATLDAGLRHLVAVGVPLGSAVDAVTRRPARLLGRADLGRLAPGARADVAVLDDDLSVTRVLVGGIEV